MKTVFLNRFLQTIFIVSLLIVTSCSKDEDGPVDPPISQEDATEFNAAMAQLGEFDQPIEANQPEQTGESDPERDDSDRSLECVVKTFKASPGFDEMLTLDPSTDVIYPGAVLKGETIPTGEYVGINLDRKPITLSASLTNISGSPVVTIEDPKLSTVREGIKQILDQEVTGATSAKINFEITQVYSEQHLDVAIGVNYRGAGKKVSSNIDFSNSQFKNKFVLKFLQQYYTIDMDSPGKDPSDLFANLPDVSALGSTSPVYVASVAYGRMVVYTIETNSSMTEVNAAFSASVGSNDGTVDAQYQQLYNSSKIQALIIGGSGGAASETINGPADVFRFISEGGNYSKDSPGAPLSYKLRYIKRDFPIARQVLTSEYPIRSCLLAYPSYKVTIEKITGTTFTDREIFGYIGARLWSNGAYVSSNPDNPGVDDAYWERNRDNFVEVQNDKTVTINTRETIVPYKPNFSNDYVEFYGQLYDREFIGSQDLGNKSLKVFLDDLPDPQNADGKFTIAYGAGITVHFRAERVATE